MALSVAAATASLGLLKQLDYSTADLEFVSLGDAANGSALGSLRWDVESYRDAASLKPYRDLVAARCPELGPVQTAQCLRSELTQRFPFGLPAVEFVDPDYLPSAALEAHLGGQAGHCMSYSALIATAMLATGVEARVVQLIPSVSSGHTAIEVRDQDGKWVFLDPTYAATAHLADGGNWTIGGMSRGAPAEWRSDGSPPVDELAEVVYARQGLLGGSLVYPEPWLYTRVGKRSAWWPFRGRFVVVGPATWELGRGHRIAYALVIAAVVAAVVAATLHVRAMLSPSARS